MSLVRFIICRGHAASCKSVAAPLDISKRWPFSSFPALNLAARVVVFMHLHRQPRYLHLSYMLEMACNFRCECVTVLRSSGVQVRMHMLCVQLRVPRTRQSPCHIGCIPTVIAFVVYQHLRSYQFTFTQAPLLLFLHQLKSTPRIIITSCLLLVLS